LLYLYHVNILTYHEIVDQVTIGRTTGEIICADDGRMSGKHAQVSVEMIDSQQVIYIEDLGSKNRTAVNRTEIPPNQKLKIKMYFMLEIGDQKFVLTDSKTVNMQDMNEMIDRHMKKTLVKLEPDESSPSAPAATPSIPKELTSFELIQAKEAKILQIHKDVTALELSAKSELMKLDEAKEKVIVNAKAKKAEMSKMMLTLKAEVEASKAQMAKIKMDMEQKKKKIINLKDLPDLPTDSTEELPE
jgi:pSer/pThr/pTyr-binding forkhead associated (FHA) protein